MTQPYILDVETTITEKGNPFCQSNKLVSIGIRNLNGDTYIYYVGDPEDKVQDYLDDCSVLIGFNIKFDLHWLRRAGYNISTFRVWDCQLAEFILEAQATPYPSLNKAAEKYNLGTKLDVVKQEYWEKGIDTDAVPRDILSEYLAMDLELTHKVYEIQKESIVPMQKLFGLQCMDLQVLQDMEYNGMSFDTEHSLRLADKELENIKNIEQGLQGQLGDVPINWNSRDHMSCYLYGGTIVHEDRLEVGLFKTGAKIGQPRYKKIEYRFDLPRQVEPPRGSELDKEGYFSTDEGTLRSIRATKDVRRVLDSILSRARSSKLVGTYYTGLPALIDKMQWPKNTIHGTFNQCVAATGRLSSSRPNLQNFAGDVKELLTTRYKHEQ
jgi:DNA polymerase I-like protein with 3'-5' exonuclease and polymerase domains